MVTGETLDDVVSRAYSDPANRSAVAGLARYVAASDHPVAQRILADAARTLIELAGLAQVRFGPLPVRYTGGVFAIRSVAERLERATAATAAAVRPEVAAAAVAARMARTAG